LHLSDLLRTLSLRLRYLLAAILLCCAYLLLTQRLRSFDFDGVLIDGMPEYWWSARRAALGLDPSLPLPEAVPPAFAALRPFIHQGWEMVLVAALLGRSGFEPPATAAAYGELLAAGLQRRGWQAPQLQTALETVRSEALEREPEAWLARHRFYPGVETRLGRLEEEGVPWLVLTTKGGAFAARLLAAAGGFGFAGWCEFRVHEFIPRKGIKGWIKC
jgi:phosphoglycolate phosphatase-like HAD superfamily hydrolase